VTFEVGTVNEPTVPICTKPQYRARAFINWQIFVGGVR
jgi:hypothetical protein